MVPPFSNLYTFLERRAKRLEPALGKEVFFISDTVKIFSHF